MFDLSVCDIREVRASAEGSTVPAAWEMNSEHRFSRAVKSRPPRHCWLALCFSLGSVCLNALVVFSWVSDCVLVRSCVLNCVFYSIFAGLSGLVAVCVCISVCILAQSFVGSAKFPGPFPSFSFVFFLLQEQQQLV
ncbi:hypothetical protein AMECASPLE_027902 [Ameca splendens]|uniref:Transmembrane protein n=1 Tax=Ameca splendens TaxID=208324 RepID=A0ABV0YSE3_9TELE